MSTDYIIGAGVKVEIGLVEGASKTISAISLANPGIASSVGHGLAFGSAGYFDTVVGMGEIDGQAARVTDSGSPSADSFGLEDIDTTNFEAFTSGVFVPVSTWATLLQSTTVNFGGGAGKTQDTTTLKDTREKLVTVQNAAETVTIDALSLKEDNTAMAKIRSTARALGFLVFRVTYPPASGQTVGAQRLFRGQPSIPGENVGKGAVGTGQLSVTVKGQVCYLAAA